MEVDRCQDLQPFHALFVGGLVEPGVILRIQMHLAEGCPACAAELGRLQGAFHAIALARAPVDPGEELLATIAREVVTTPQERAEPVIVYAATDERRLLWALVVLCGVMVAAVAYWAIGGRDALAEAEQGQRFAQVQAAQAEAGYKRLQDFLNQLTSPRVTTHDLPAGSGGLGTARARVFVDLGARRLTVRTVGLVPGQGGELYAFWWREDDREEFVGLLDPVMVARGSTARFPLPAWAALPARLILSLESGSRSPDAPRAGKVVLEGQLISGQPCGSPASPLPDPG